MIKDRISYKFHPNQRHNSPGFASLEMIIQGDDKSVSRDLEEATLLIANSEELPETTFLSHPWNRPAQEQVCTGNIALRLKQDEKIIAFTFGGQLQVQSQSDKTVFILTSPAPILRYEGFNQISTILADEVNILLAEKRVREISDLDAYKKRLVCTNPLLLYCTCLKELRDKFTHYVHPDTPSQQSFSNFITSEIETLQSEGLWPNRVPDLEMI
jgi:hypothetical protein